MAGAANPARPSLRKRPYIPYLEPIVETNPATGGACSSVGSVPLLPADANPTPSDNVGRGHGPCLDMDERDPASAPYVPHQTRHRTSSRPWHILSLILSSLWLALIITLLVLNFKEHVIGASVWCPFGHCSSDAFSSNAIVTAVRLDKEDQDILAGLQFVAQAFEIWFLFIAAALLYEIGMLFARSPRGLPIGLLMAYIEFSHVNFLFNSHLWTSAFPPQGAPKEDRRAQGALKLFLFALLAAFLTILTNLMGAAIAVLLIPSLTWVQTPKSPAEHFSSMATSRPPQPPGCSSAQILAGNYSCTADAYGAGLDAWATTAQASIRQYQQPNGIAILGTSQEASVQFALNGSSDLQVIWVANRQVLRQLSADYLEVVGRSEDFLIVETDDSFPDRQYNKSLRTILDRTGPAIGIQTNCYSGNISVTKIANDKEIHCYSSWSLDYVHYYTKCFRIGTGFSSSNTLSRFFLDSEPPLSNTSTNLVQIFVSFSDLAIYYNDTTDFGSNIIPCLSNSTAATNSCDWDRIFTVPLPTDLQNSSRNVGLVSYSIPSSPNPQTRVYCDTIHYLTFPTYTLDTSPSSNELHLVQFSSLPPTIASSAPLSVHPDWSLAAWSVDRDGVVGGSRPIAKALTRVLNSLGANGKGEIGGNGVLELELFLHHIYALGQAMSLVNYETTAPPRTYRRSQVNDLEKPVFTKSARMHVWAWSLSGRTSNLGVVIAICGCVCVVVRVVLGICISQREISALELFTAALERRPDTDSLDVIKGSGDKGKVRMRVIEEAEEKTGEGLRQRKRKRRPEGRVRLVAPTLEGSEGERPGRDPVNEDVLARWRRRRGMS